MSHRNRWWQVMVLAAALATAECLRAPEGAWPWLAAALAMGAAVLVARAPLPRARWVLVALLAALAAQLVTATRELGRIRHAWPAEREERIVAYGARIDSELRGAFRAAGRLAAQGVAAATLPRDQAFRALDAAVPGRGLETAVAILDSSGAPYAWAGRHRLSPEPQGDSIAVRASGYYVTLETRRHSGPRTVVASVLIWADSAVVDRQRSVAERFRHRTEVGLLVYPIGATVPDNTDVFDYEEPTTAGQRLLFSVQPVPPQQDEAWTRVFGRAGRAALACVVAALATLVWLSPPGNARLLAFPALLWLLARAPVTALLAPGAPAGSAGAPVPPLVLLLGGLSLLAVVVRAWPPAARTRARAAAGAVAGVLAAVLAWWLGERVPAAELADGVMPWLLWHAAILTSALPLAAVGAALLASPPSTGRRWRAALPVMAAGGLALSLALSWLPGDGWPLGVALGFGVVVAAAAAATPRAVAIGASAAVLGLLAALLLWRADVEHRAGLALADIAALHDSVADAVPLLERFAARASAAPVPVSAAELYGLWQGSALARAGLPVELALWLDAEGQHSRLSLDSLAVSDDLLAALARGLPDSVGAFEVHRLDAVPAAHHALALRVAPGTALTVTVGPASALVPRGRLGRLLAPEARPDPPYRLVLTAPAADPTLAPKPRWRRDGAVLRTERVVVMPGGSRNVMGVVDLVPAVGLLVRGLLIVVFSVAVAGSLWFVIRAITGEAPLRLGWSRATRSFRLRLALALSAFFVIPTLAFAIWSFAHFGDEAERGRDLLITRTLRTAAAGAEGLLRMPGVSADLALRGLSDRVDADLALYRGGLLVATSAPVLRDLGVVSPLMEPAAFELLALQGNLETTRDGVIPTLAERVGYRVIEFGPASGLGVLSTPQPGGLLDAGRERRELALVLLLAAVAGLAAAVGGAGIASRALSRPVADLRRAAVAVGQGRPTPLPSLAPPVEFEPVFGAFQRMAADVAAGRRALEAARRRTATVIATVATGVVALDPGGRVMLANARARELVGATLEEGDDAALAFTGEWSVALDLAHRVLHDPAAAAEEEEASVGEQRVVLQAAPLGPEVSGVVLAMHDVTAVSRAERVLAWGEMAQQVAHEIKNPLTPMRLGIQHLRRAWEGGRGDFGGTLAETSDRILAEIARLDTIARAFARFAAPAPAAVPLEPVDVAAVATEVIQLYRLAEEGATVTLDGRGAGPLPARRDEVKEVLVNLLENARDAGASSVRITLAPSSVVVRDDGAGIPADLLPRIFEPRFSTTTSGSGLGLAIVKRLVESWGADVSVASVVGEGTTVTVRWLDPPVGN